MAENIRAKIPPTSSSFQDYLSENRCQNSFFLRPTQKDEILKIIKNIDKSKSVGPNSIPQIVLTCIDEEISTVLSKIFNLSMSQGKFIDTLKTVKVVPIFKKKGSQNEIGNFRPISLLSNIDKIFEKLIHKRMASFIKANKILYEKQFQQQIVFLPLPKRLEMK